MSIIKVGLRSKFYMFVIFRQANYRSVFQQERKKKNYHVLFVLNSSSCYIYSSGLFLAALLYNIFLFYFIRRIDTQYLYASLLEKCPNTDQKLLRIWILFTQCLGLKLLQFTSKCYCAFVTVLTLSRCDNHISPSGNGWVYYRHF